MGVQPIMKRSILVVCLSLLAAVASAGSLRLSDGWIRLLPAGVPAAGYFALRNAGRAPAQLVAATSPAFGEVMLHKSTEEKGRSTMVHLDKVEVPAGGEVVFKPGSYHLMLIKPTRALRIGEKVSVTFEFANGEKITEQFEVRGPSGK
ncbi:MAG: copper chaperone PCu(A)C [Betaproteobacteria bacterium]|nr:copper chaperone PCu(A)C [Betaproteobacteria bacterium]